MEKKYSNKYLIETGIGLQDVDHLKNSTYFINESERYIKGEITLNDLEDLITKYYKSKPNEEERAQEADEVSIRIGQLISEDSFSFSIGQLIAIHKYLFDGILYHPGKLRTYNFTKEEWVLDGDTVIYGDYRELQATLQYDFSAEKEFNYKGLSIDEIINHLAMFIANLWQIHIFEEGNTRTTAVFVIKYLRSLGFDISNDVFSKNAWYFRNALVRANYRNYRKGVYEDRSFLIKFLRNLLLNEKHPLKNRELHISENVDSNNDSKESRIVGLMKNNPNITTEEIANELGFSVRTIKSVIATLEQNDTIERVGGKKLGTWKVNK